MLAWPAADVPVVQLSLQTQLGPGHHFELGRALAPLAREDVLILGSGGFTHDLSSWREHGGGPEPAWVTDFADWLDAAIREGRTRELLDYRRLAPHAARNHPTEEHLLPLFVALGAGGAGGAGRADAPATRLHSSNPYGVLRMDAYAFGG